MKRLPKILYICLACTLLTSCWSRHEIDSLAIVMGLSVDKAKSDNEEELFNVSAQIVVPENVGVGQDSSGDGKAFFNFTSISDNVSPAITDMANESGNIIYMPHSTAVIFGKEVAQEGIYKHLDFFMRDNEFRLTVLLFVAEEEGRQILETDSGLLKLPSLNLAKLGESLYETSDGRPTRVFDFFNCLMGEQISAMVPIVGRVEEHEEAMMKINSTAVFIEDKMVGELSPMLTRGVLWVTDEVNGGVLKVEIDGKNMDLKIEQTKCTLEPIFDDGGVKMQLNIMADTHIQRDENNLINVYGVDALKNLAGSKIKDEIVAALDQTRLMGADVYGFGNMIYRHNPKLWNQIKDNWTEEFRNLEISIVTDVKISILGNIAQSAK